MEEYKKHLKEIFVFSLPLIAGQIGQMLFSIGDIAIAGRYSNEVLSALGIATALFGPFLMVGMGITFAVGPIAARMRGENIDSRKMLGTSFITSIGLSLILIPLVEIMIFNLDLFGLVPIVRDLVADYLHICVFSTFGILIFQVFKEYLQAWDDTYFANGTILAFNVLNIFMNIIFMFGMFGFPEMGIKGAALATVINRLLMAITLYFYTLKKFPFKIEIDWDEVKEILNLGLPIGGSTLIEVLVWSICTVLVGKMTVVASASHNIVLNLTTLTFMIPMAMSSAAAVKVGHAFGKKDLHNIGSWTFAAISVSSFFMIITALAYFFIPSIIIRLGSDAPEIIQYGSQLLLFVAIFQIPDGIQYTMMGCLRGIGVTKIPMVLSFMANWMIGLPVGYYLAHEMNMEAAGLWAGLATGLYFLSISLTVLFIYKRKRLIQSFN